MHFTILEEIKSTLPKSLFYNHYSQIKSNDVGFWLQLFEGQMSFFNEPFVIDI